MNSNNFWADMLNAQKGMMESWQKAFAAYQGDKEDAAYNPFAAYNPYRSFMDLSKNMQNMQAMMNGWQAMMDNWKPVMESWQKSMQSFPGFPKMDGAAANPFFTYNPYQNLGSFNPMDSQSYFKYWQTMMENWNELSEQWKKYTEENPYMKNLSEAFGSFEMPKLDFAPLQAWQKAMEMYNPMEMGKYMSAEAKEVFEKSLNANQFKLAAYKVWEDMKKLYIDPTSEDYKEKAAELSAKYEQVLKEYLLPMIPAEMRSFVQSPYTLFKDGVTTMQKFSAPWFESMGKMFDLMMQAGLKDPSKSSDLMLLWKSNYDKTVGELMKSPVVGSNRELIEQQNKAVDRLVEMTLAMSEYIGSIMTVANEKSKQGFEHYYEMIQKGEQPKTFNEFYKFISNEIENAIENFYYTDEFGQIIGKAADAYMQFKIELDKLIEKYLNDTPIITVSKVDNAFKNVYDLRKDMKSLTKKVADLEKKLATDKPAAK